MMKNWRATALEVLDALESSRAPTGITITKFAALCGVSRWTIMRDEVVRSRYQALLERAKGTTAPGTRLRLIEQVRQLRQENEKLKRQQDAMLERFVSVCRRLLERGLDPVELLGEPVACHHDSKHTMSRSWIDQ